MEYKPSLPYEDVAPASARPMADYAQLTQTVLSRSALQLINADKDPLLAEYRQQTDRFHDMYDTPPPLPNTSDKLFADILDTQRQQDYQGKKMRGPLAGLVEANLRSFHEDLTAIDPRLSGRHIVPTTYMDINTQKEVNSFIDEPFYEDFQRMVRNKNDYMLPTMEASFNADHTTTANGAFTIPEHIAMAHAKACVLACYNMALADITGTPLSERLARAKLDSIYGSSLIGHEPLLNVLESERFATQTGNRCRTISFTGMTLAKLVEVSHRLRTPKPDRSVYVTAYIQSLRSGSRNIWHSVVLTDVTDDTVYFRDPSVSNSTPDSMPKQEFAYRWGVAYNSGFMIISDKVGAAPTTA